MARKTYGVKALVERVNTMLATPNSTLWMKAPGKDRDLTPEEAFRMGMISVLESVLHETGNYKGFGYQTGVITWDVDVHPPVPVSFSDETRRIYY